jgi:hypothetical protein
MSAVPEAPRAGVAGGDGSDLDGAGSGVLDVLGEAAGGDTDGSGGTDGAGDADGADGADGAGDAGGAGGADGAGNGVRRKPPLLGAAVATAEPTGALGPVRATAPLPTRGSTISRVPGITVYGGAR